jgi:hypothetical protein
MSFSRWLRRLGKKQMKEQENRYDFPTVNTGSQGEYVPRQVYEALEERVSAIEREFSVSQIAVDSLIFPSEVLESLPTVVKKTIEGIIFNYEHDFPDFCFLGMRKALIDAIRIRFQRAREEALLYDKKGDAFKLAKWIELAKQRKFISRTEASNLNEIVKVFGDTASHDYMANLQKDEVPSVFTCLRMALGTMYYPEESS